MFLEEGDFFLEGSLKVKSPENNTISWANASENSSCGGGVAEEERGERNQGCQIPRYFFVLWQRDFHFLYKQGNFR